MQCRKEVGPAKPQTTYAQQISSVWWMGLFWLFGLRVDVSSCCCVLPRKRGRAYFCGAASASDLSIRCETTPVPYSAQQEEENGRKGERRRMKKEEAKNTRKQKEYDKMKTKDSFQVSLGSQAEAEGRLGDAMQPLPSR